MSAYPVGLSRMWRVIAESTVGWKYPGWTGSDRFVHPAWKYPYP